MAHHHAVGAAREAAIGDQGHLVAEAFADDRGGGGEHLAHARSANRALIADHHHIPFADLFGEDRGEGLLLALEHPGRAGEHRRFHTTDLRHAALAGEVALEDGQVPLGVERVTQRPNHVLAGGWFGGDLRQHLPEGAAFHGAAVAVKQARIEQQPHHLGDATGPVQIHGHVTAAWLEVADHRHPLADDLEIVDVEGHAGGAGHRQQVQHGIGGAPHRHDHADGVLERLAGHQVAGADALGDRLDQHLGATGGAVGLLRILRRHGGAEGQTEAHRLESGAHRVGGEHAAAATGAGTGVLLDRGELGLIDPAAAVLTHRLKGAHHSEIAGAELAGLDRAAVHEHRGDVHAGHRQHGAGHVLVAAAHRQQPVHALGVAGGLDRIGDHLAAHQGILHPLGAHRDAIAHGDRAEHLRHRTGQQGRLLGAAGQVVEPHVARGDGAVAVGNADDRLVEIVVAETHGPQHGAVWRPLDPLGDGGGAQHGGGGRVVRKATDRWDPALDQGKGWSCSSWRRTSSMALLSCCTRSCSRGSTEAAAGVGWKAARG